jgi:hypothetical protein
MHTSVEGLPSIQSGHLIRSSSGIGSNLYHYRDPINSYVVDRWWGKLDCARLIMDFDTQIRVKMDFSNVWPSS